MSLELVPVQSRRDIKEFVALPWRLFDRKAHPQWVPPLRLMVHDALDTRKNPFYRNADRALWLAYRDGKPAGRIAAVENRAHNDFYRDRVGFFGFFESANDPEAASSLIRLASSWLEARGLDVIRGPMSPSTNQECGLLVDGFEHHPYFLTAWNPPYYESLMLGAGLQPVKDLLGYRIALEEEGVGLAERYAVHARRALEQGKVTFRDLDLGNFKREVEIWYDVYNSAWEENWGFVPMPREEFRYMAKELRPLIDTRYAFVAEVDGEPAGMLLLIPDYNEIFKRIPSGRLLPTGLFRLMSGRKKLRTGRIILLGVKKAHRTRSIFPLLMHEIVRRGNQTGLTTGEASWVLEDNSLMNRPLVAMGGVPYRRWRIYERPLSPRAARSA